MIQSLEKVRNVKYGSNLKYTSEGSETAAVMTTACHYAIEAATKTITFFCRLYETASIQKVQCFQITHMLQLANFT